MTASTAIWSRFGPLVWPTGISKESVEAPSGRTTSTTTSLQAAQGSAPGVKGMEMLIGAPPFMTRSSGRSACAPSPFE